MDRVESQDREKGQGLILCVDGGVIRYEIEIEKGAVLFIQYVAVYGRGHASFQQDVKARQTWTRRKPYVHLASCIRY